jgi:uncharacterized membrane protein
MNVGSVGLLALLASAALVDSALAAVSIEYLGYGAATDMSPDGSVIVGNTNGDYETFRWTSSTGIVPLGRATVPVLGSGAGAPEVSDDGTRISATILGEDGTYMTQGVWTLGAGWTETMPPPPPTGGLLDNAYGSAWGISGDGNTVVGLYWRPGQTDGTAHASAWTEATGTVDMGSSGRDSRINTANYDGSVMVGWDANPGFGNWWPTVWVDGVRTTLSTDDVFAQAIGVSADGTLVLGQDLHEPSGVVGAALWRWSGTEWVEETLGALFATHPVYGEAGFYACSTDGSVIVGYNAFDPGNQAGLLWTEETGLVNIEQYLLANGITLDPNLTIRSLTGITADGSIACGVAQELSYPFDWVAVRIFLDPATAAPELSRRSAMGRNYPNPFNPSTVIPVTLERTETVELEIFDVRGQSVRVLHSGVLGAGRHEFIWDGKDRAGASVASGSYMARLRHPGGIEQSQRMVLLK